MDVSITQTGKRWLKKLLILYVIILHIVLIWWSPYTTFSIDNDSIIITFMDKSIFISDI